jgi:phosphatidylinositol glycan class W
MFLGINVLLTCICILAVDFAIFPRVYAKTEYFGISLMDVGVGMFIISSAVSSSFARNGFVASTGSPPPSPPGIKQTDKMYFKYSTVQRLFVLLLGFGRLVILKALNYQDKSSEYGTHWNFFVTLFFVWTIADVVHKLLKFSSTLIMVLSVVLLGTYQLVLVRSNLTEFMLYGSREGSFWAANREGINSLCGFVPLYLMTEVLSARLLFGHGTVGTSRASGSSAGPPSENGGRKRFLNMSLVVGVMWVGWAVTDEFVQRTSRRLTNASYILLALSLGWTVVLIMRLVDAIQFTSMSISKMSHHQAQPQSQAQSVGNSTERDGSGSGGGITAVSVINSSSRILELLNSWQLPIFLVANVMTGCVNLSMTTHRAPDALAFGVLILYTLVIVAALWAMNKFFQRKP